MKQPSTLTCVQQQCPQFRAQLDSYYTSHALSGLVQASRTREATARIAILPAESDISVTLQALQKNIYTNSKQFDIRNEGAAPKGFNQFRGAVPLCVHITWDQ